MALALITDEQTKEEIYINTNQICFMEQDADCVNIHMSDRTCLVARENMQELVANIRILEGLERVVR